MAISDRARDIRRNYMRKYMQQYRKKHPSKKSEQDKKYWEKKALESKGGDASGE